MTKRQFAFWFLGAIVCASSALAKAPRPNVVLIITDDQGYGDLGFHGNPKIRTPHLDRLARESARIQRFYVSPVCAPTRASLLTGRYAYRTGVVDTFLGRALMHPDEVTLAEMLGPAGYRTAIFGKWHLGDNFPMRPMDQGFRESLVLRGGGIGQPSDSPLPGGDSYFDPFLQHNGRQTKASGYCSDVFTEAAIEFIAQSRDNPFFVYLAFNAPHTPLQVPDRDYLPYKALDLTPATFPSIGQPLPASVEPDVTARVYGMVANIDTNVGRLLSKLDSLSLADDTIVIFLTDNGPQQPRFNAGMRDRKGSVYEGGIRVPCFLRWPGHFSAGRAIEPIAGAIDITPTILDATGVAAPPSVALDGRSLLPLLKGETVDWPERTLYLQWHRGDVPQIDRAFAAVSQRYKLLRPESSTAKPVAESLELYDLAADPFEFQNIAAGSPEIARRMRTDYEAWFADVSRARGFVPPRIVLGAVEENPSLLTRQDWRGPKAGWAPNDLGHWEVQIARDGNYSLGLRFAQQPKPAAAHLKVGEVHVRKEPGAEETRCTFEPVALPSGPFRLEAWLEAGKDPVGASYVEVRRLD